MVMKTSLLFVAGLLVSHRGRRRQRRLPRCVRTDRAHKRDGDGTPSETIARFDGGWPFPVQLGVTHTVQFKDALTDTTWQTLQTITGDGTLQQVTDSTGGASRVYRVSSKN